jgi:hypothetical protein
MSSGVDGREGLKGRPLPFFLYLLTTIIEFYLLLPGTSTEGSGCAYISSSDLHIPRETDSAR